MWGGGGSRSQPEEANSLGVVASQRGTDIDETVGAAVSYLEFWLSPVRLLFWHYYRRNERFEFAF